MAPNGLQLKTTIPKNSLLLLFRVDEILYILIASQKPCSLMSYNSDIEIKKVTISQ